MSNKSNKYRKHLVVFWLLWVGVAKVMVAQSPMDEYARYALMELGIEKKLWKEDAYSKQGVKQIKVYESTLDTIDSLEIQYHKRTFSLDSLGRFERVSHEVGGLNGHAPESIDSIYYDPLNRIARVVLYHKNLKGKYSTAKYSYAVDTLDGTFHYEMEKNYHQVNQVMKHEIVISTQDACRELLECLNDRLVNRSCFIDHADTAYWVDEHWSEEDDSIYLKWMTESVYDANDRLTYTTYFDYNPVSRHEVPKGDVTHYAYDSQSREILRTEHISNAFKMYQTVYNDELKTISHYRSEKISDTTEAVNEAKLKSVEWYNDQGWITREVRYMHNGTVKITTFEYLMNPN